MFPEKKLKARPTSEELDALRAQIEARKAEIEELQAIARPKPSRQEISQKAAVTRLKNKAALYRQRRADGDFSESPPRKPLPVTEEMKQARHEADQAVKAWHDDQERLRLKNRSLVIKALDIPWQTSHFIRAWMASFDVSALRRQGGFVAAAHPKLAADAAAKMIQSFASERAASDVEYEIRNRENFGNGRYKRSRLELIGITTSLKNGHAPYMGRWIKNTIGVKQSERSYVTLLNLMRANLFDTLTATMSATGTPTLTEERAIADFVNIATGSGVGLGPATAVLSQAFWSPRFMLSRIQLALLQPLWGGTLRTRSLIAREYARGLIGYAAYLSLLSLAYSALPGKDEVRVGLDPRSTDFLKIIIGKTRIDPMAGLSQVFVLLTRLNPRGSGAVSTTGKRYDVYGPKAGSYHRADALIQRFFWQKLAPVPAMAIDAAQVLHGHGGTDAFGRPLSLEGLLLNAVQPLSVRDVVTAMQELGVERGVAASIGAIFGNSVNNYEKKTGSKGPGPSRLETLELMRKSN